MSHDSDPSDRDPSDLRSTLEARLNANPALLERIEANRKEPERLVRR